MQTGNETGGRRGKYGRLLKNTAILSLGTFASKILVFLLLPLYTNYLSTNEYSTADLITNMANFLIPIFCCGVTEGVFRFSLREKDTENHSRESVFSTCTVITLVGSLVLLALLPLFCFVGDLGTYGLLVVLYVISANLHSIAAEYVRACEQTTLYTVQGVLNTALVIVLNLVLLLGFDAGITGYVLSVVLADFLTTVFLVFYARLYRVFSLRSVRRKTARALIAFSLPLVPATMLWWVISVSDRYLLTVMLESGSDINGLYVAAAKIPTLLTLLCTVFLTAWKTSAVVENSGDGEAEKKKKSEFYGSVYKGFVAVLFCMGAGIVLFAQLFAKILFSDAFYEAWRYIPLLTLGTVFYSLSRFLGSIYFVKRKSVHSFLTALFAAVLNVILNLVLIPSYGAFGAAAATLAAYLLEFIVRDIDAQKQLCFPAQRLRILVCGILLLCEVVVMSSGLTHSLWIAAGLTVAILLVNARVLLGTLKGIFHPLVRRAGK